MLFFFILPFTLTYFETEALEFIEVNTTVGTIKGFCDDYVKFLGVPYGFVDEKHPFEPATPYPPFNSTFNAFTDPVQCPQRNLSGIISGDIHCLNLNIFTPRTKPRDLLPVIVYIFGGQYRYDNGNQQIYNPRFLIRKNVIFVSFNYRLGVFGFICIRNEFGNRYTNQGLKDQRLAIDWVKRNIIFFGGDPNNIVLMGHSSGSMSLDLHLLYDNDNSITKYILQGGNAPKPQNVMDKTPQELLKDFKLHLENVSEIYDIIEHTTNWTFLPCLDGEYITQQPKVETLKNVQILTGGTDSESLVELVILDKSFYETYDMTADLTSAFTKNATDMTAEVNFLRKLYKTDENKFKIVDFRSDFFVNYPTERAIRYYLSKNATVRTYRFSYMGMRNYMKNLKHLTGSSVTTHGDELGYLFDVGFLQDIPYASDDWGVVELMTTLWTHFAKFGDIPSWPPTTIDNRRTLIINNSKPFMVADDKNRFASLDLVYKLNYDKYKKGVDVGNFV